jgi:hypothetical protein
MSCRVHTRIIGAVALTITFGVATADCMQNRKGDLICGKGQCQRDRKGMVLCSAFHNGSAVRTIDGRILCGKGACVKTLKGQVFCSSVEEGFADKDMHGVPRCEGQCEPAVVDYCEAKPAGTALD